MVFDDFIKLLSPRFGLVYPGMGLTYVNKDLNMAAIIFSLQNFKHLKIKNEYIDTSLNWSLNMFM